MPKNPVFPPHALSLKVSHPRSTTLFTKEKKKGKTQRLSRMGPSRPSSTPTLHDGGFYQILNFRDVGATINARLDRKLLREGLLFRSARPDEATMADRDRLQTHYGIRTVMDLRSKTEHLRAAEKRAADGKVPALLQSNEALAEPVQIPGIEYREVKITGGGFEKHMLGQLKWPSFL